MTDVRRATKSDRATAARTLGAAFVTDPIMSWMLRDRCGEKHLRSYFHAELGALMTDDDHLTFVAGDSAAVAAWRGVNKWKSGVPEFLRIAPAGFRAFRVRAGIRALQKIERVHPREPHYYLDSVGTRPDRQGEGLGAALIRIMTHRADTEGLPCYLESSNPANEAFYMRQGFVVRDEVEIAPGAPVIRTMWRVPREADQT